MGFSETNAVREAIAFNVMADGNSAVHADNEDDLEFDDDTRRDIDKWVDVVRYLREAELVELDDLSAADRTTVTIPTFEEVTTRGKCEPNKAHGKVHAEFKLVFNSDGGDDDGVYYVKITVSNRPPPQKAR